MAEYPVAQLSQTVRQRLLLIEQAFAAAALMLYSGGPINVILTGGYSQGDRQVAEPDFAITRNLFLLTYIIIAALLFVRWKRAIRSIPYGLIVWAAVGFAGLSYVWSAIPDETFSSTIALIGTTLFGIYIATRYTPRQQLQLLGWAFGLIIVLSLGYAVLLPKYGIMGGVHAGTWRGIYTHKNTLGKMMTLSSTIFTLLLLSDRRHRPVLGLFLSLSIALLLLTTSKGALVTLVAMLGAIAVCQVLRAHYRWMVVLIGTLVLVVGAIAAVLSLNLETIVVDLLGKDLTLTGRTTLWGYAIDMIRMQPWLGYGYEAFWDGMDGPSAYIWRAVKWPAPDAHNGFIELTLHLGLVGLTIFLVGYGINVVRSIVKVRATATVDFIWPLTYLIYIILSNITEQALLKSNNLFWVIYVTVSLTLFMPTQRVVRLPESTPSTTKAVATTPLLVD
ncbi:MAG: O-antigen ligase family protein [Leptolyngbyaceae cyanobacterium SL_7_1]|nr:O-antigen ligase family protein [Leptolyngbyaceae cyanobacterium SL_7_1]